MVLVLTSARAAISRSTASAWPFKHAMRRGVAPDCSCKAVHSARENERQADGERRGRQATIRVSGGEARTGPHVCRKRVR